VLVSTGYGTAELFPADGAGPPVQGWARYAQAVARELDALGRPAVGLAATISSDLPPEAGLSSSAALEVGIALALCEVAHFHPAPLELARACARAEERAVGVPCGLLDQVACLLGRAGSALLLDCATLEHRDVPLPSELVLLVIDPGRPRALASSGYATRRAEVARALARAGVDWSSDLDEAALDRVEEKLVPRLRHVFTENARVKAFADALQRNDLAAAGRFVSASHASLRDDYEVSTPELDTVVGLAERAGAYGARLVGGGFGGSVLALASEPLASRVSEALEEHGARTFVVQAANGARVLSS